MDARVWIRSTFSGLLLLFSLEVAAVEIVGHRGASHDAPENTLAAFRLAFSRGADAVECDVHLSADGRLVVIHDADTKRTTGRRLVVARSNWEQLLALDAGSWKGERFRGERLPLLEQVLELVPPGRGLLIEVKCGPEMVPRLLPLLQERTDGRRLLVISFNLEVVSRLKQRRPGQRVLWLVKARRRPGGGFRPHPRDIVATARDNHLDGLGLDRRGVNDDIMAAARAAGLAVYVWTVDDQAEARQLVERGATGIITNRPGWLRGRLEEGRNPPGDD